jgi:hypothetical protein
MAALARYYICNQLRTYAQGFQPINMDRLIPVPKISCPTSPTHFRPISMQPYLGLLIEKCAELQLVDFMEYNNVFYKGQIGSVRSL